MSLFYWIMFSFKSKMVLIVTVGPVKPTQPTMNPTVSDIFVQYDIHQLI